MSESTLRGGGSPPPDRVAAAAAMVGACLVVLCTACKPARHEPSVQASEYVKPDTPPKYEPPSGAVEQSVTFSDVTGAAGIEFRHVTGAFGKKWMPETMGGGASFFDYDGDGSPDLLLVNSGFWPGHEEDGAKPVSRLYRNRGRGEFEDVTERAGLSELTLYGMGATVADYDGDGDEDVYLTAVGKNRLLRNDGGRYVDVTDEAGVGFSAGEGAPSPWEWSSGAMWLDTDRDGDLDLFVANYVQWTPATDIWSTLDGKNKSYATPQPYDGASCTLFTNNGDGTFADTTKQAGVYNPAGKSMGVISADLNDDGWPDIVVTNDTQPNFLYLNNQNGTFTDHGLSAGVAYDESGLARAGMGVGIADLTNAGRCSIAIGNFSGEPVSLYTQAGIGTFIDKAGATRLTKPTTATLTFGLTFADFNLDGFEDLMLANGHIEPEIEHVRRGWTFEQSPQLFLNNGRGQFVEVGEEAGEGFRRPMVGRGLSTADIDDDGDLDAVIATVGGAPRLLRNDLPPGNNVVRVRLVGAGKNRAAVGARLRATLGGQTQTRYITTGGSYLSQSELTATFGLGAAETIDRLEIRWPDGESQDVAGLAADALYTIERGTGVTHTKPLER